MRDFCACLLNPVVWGFLLVAGGNLEGTVHFVVDDDADQEMTSSSDRDEGDDSYQYPTYSPYSNYHELDAEAKQSYYQWNRYNSKDPAQYRPYYPNYMHDDYQTQTFIVPNGYQNTVVVPQWNSNEIYHHHHREHKEEASSTQNASHSNVPVNNDTTQKPQDKQHKKGDSQHSH